jgi:hypothetical protein
MRRTAIGFVSLLAIVGTPPASFAAGPLQRFALIVGANFGGRDRPRLQYAIADAERFARVMVELGGVSASGEILLKQPKLKELVDALDLLSARVAEAKRSAPNGGRTEVILYYSGHADEKGLLLGEDRYAYPALRDRLDQIPADVRIAVLDACASGAFTRVKGGRARPPFLVDESAAMRGHAFLTSSAETEAAQESDRIRASYFTHFLISGLRGAADLSGDGRITLNEAYQFAFSETLGRTVDTKGGAQHPSYDINMSGTGDVIMTDVRQTSATLVLGDTVDGRFYVRNAAQDLVVELYKPYGRTVELGVEPGAYEIRVERDKASLVAKTNIDDGARVVLEPRQFGPATREATRTRGGFDAPPAFAVAGRNRVALRMGMWQWHEDGAATSTTVASGTSSHVRVGLQYARFVSEKLAFTLAADALDAESGASVGPNGVFSGDAAVLTLAVGIRSNPFKGDHRLHAVKPFVAADIGPVIGLSDGAFVGGGDVFSGSRSDVTIGGHAGGGVDFHIARWLTIGIDGGYNWMAPFSVAIGTRRNYSGFVAGVGFGWMFGRGDAPHPSIHTRGR